MSCAVAIRLCGPSKIYRRLIRSAPEAAHGEPPPTLIGCRRQGNCTLQAKFVGVHLKRLYARFWRFASLGDSLDKLRKAGPGVSQQDIPCHYGPLASEPLTRPHA